jgi:hypothetical protein
MKHIFICVAVAAVSVLTVSGSGCAHKPTNPEVTQVSPTDVVMPQTGPSKVNERKSLVIAYDKGQIVLGKLDRQNISDLVEGATYSPYYDRLDVVVWADKDTAGGAATLPKGQLKLARDRINEIQKFLMNKYDISDEKIYNMTETTNWLARAFNSRDDELKSVFASEQSVPMSNDEFDFIRHNGDAGKAVLIVVHL